MAAEGIFGGIFEGCIPGLDSAIERRPYHKNCGCALCAKQRRKTSNNRRNGSSERVSFPIRRSWSEGNIMAMNFASSSASSSSSNLQSISSSSSLTTLAGSSSSSDLTVDPSRFNQQLRWTIEEGEDH